MSVSVIVLSGFMCVEYTVMAVVTTWIGKTSKKRPIKKRPFTVCYFLTKTSTKINYCYIASPLYFQEYKDTSKGLHS